MGKRKGITKRVKIYSFCLIAISLLCIWISTYSYYASAETKAKDAQKSGTIVSNLENDKFKLEFSNDYSSFLLTDKQTGKVWSSSMNDQMFNMDNVNKKWKEKMTSLFTVNVTELKKGFGVIVSYDLAGTPYTAKAQSTEEGISIAYDLSAAGIRLNVEISLSGDGIKLRIPSKSIEEYSNFSLVTIDVMPFFAGTADGQEGYLFYPDGSGAIMRFDDPSHWNEAAKSYVIYGDIEKHEILNGYFHQNEPTVMLPVFGGNFGEEGFVAYMGEGEESSKITVVPSGNIIASNYIYGSFIYRRGFNDPRVTSKSLKIYDAERLKNDYEINYTILSKGSSSYTDMATAYRNYLLKENKLTKKENADQVTLALDLFMGIEEKGMLFDSLQSLTTFDQAKQILKDLKESVSGKMEATLIGWTASGYGTEPKFLPANRKLGGSKGLSNLLKYTKSEDISLYLETDFLTARTESSGYSKKNDVVYLNNHMILTDIQDKIRLLSPKIVKKNYSELMEEIKDDSLSGLSLKGIGDMVYFNYGKKNAALASECKTYWNEMLSNTKETFGSVISGGGNSYVLSIADRVTKIPYKDSGYQMTTKSVPFYQIVVHGYVDYTGEPGNLSSDLDKVCLKWIEYGYLPYYELTWDSPERLMYTEYNSLFSSKYLEWEERIVESYNKIQQALGNVINEEIVFHDELMEEVYCTGYSNGTKIYVNYNKEEVTVDGIIIQPRDFVVKEDAK